MDIEIARDLCHGLPFLKDQAVSPSPELVRMLTPPRLLALLWIPPTLVASSGVHETGSTSLDGSRICSIIDLDRR